jgi:FkbM family methyltransferase
LSGDASVPHFVSYAQNFEDVILWRALKHVDDGFYVDCGAYDPVRDSVTKAFYDRGWRGINIEPIPTLLKEFVQQRPRDINLAVALSDNSDGASFYEIPETGLSTLFLGVARRHIDSGFAVREISVPTKTLSEVLSEVGRRTIHFLKVDVEGAEHLVLGGTDFEIFRPWVVLVEATQPRTQKSSAAGWETSLLASGYRFVYFDGLNRFYLANEHSELADLLAIPPNVFDDFVLHGQLEKIEAIKRSTSWRITAPLRNAKKVYEILRDNVPRLARKQLCAWKWAFSRSYLPRQIHGQTSP